MWSGDRDGNVEMWNAETGKKMPKELPSNEDGEMPSKHRDKISCFVLTHGRVMWSIAWDIDSGSHFLLWD